MSAYASGFQGRGLKLWVLGNDDGVHIGGVDRLAHKPFNSCADKHGHVWESAYTDQDAPASMIATLRLYGVIRSAVLAVVAAKWTIAPP